MMSAAAAAPRSDDKRRSKTTVGILGTGRFATAFCRRLSHVGYSVTLGSRTPDDVRKTDFFDDVTSSPSDVTVTSYKDCVASNDVIIVAVQAEHFEGVFTKELSSLCGGKILVDVSNREREESQCCGVGDDDGEMGLSVSNAHDLRKLVPEAIVAKAFNAVPAYVMENYDIINDVTRFVTVACDDAHARAVVCELARELGFEPRDGGRLENARRMEKGVLRLFPEWRIAVVLTACLLLFWFLFAVSRFYFTDNKLSWNQLPLKVMNKVIAVTSLTLLALTYLPGPMATLMEWTRTWKKKRSAKGKEGGKGQGLPKWMKNWLTSRKQLGLMTFALLCLHVIISALLLSPVYMSSWYVTRDVIVKINVTSEIQATVVTQSGAWMTWVGELCLLCGILAFAVISLLAVTSLPSVSQSLSWAEWRLLHSRLADVMLVLAVTHVCVMSWKQWVTTGFPLNLFRIRFISVLLPSHVILCRMLLVVMTIVVAAKRRAAGPQLSGSAEKRAASEDHEAMELVKETV